MHQRPDLSTDLRLSPRVRRHARMVAAYRGIPALFKFLLQLSDADDSEYVRQVATQEYMEKTRLRWIVYLVAPSNRQKHQPSTPGHRIYDRRTLEHIGWTEGDGSGHAGYNVNYYFADGVYLGPDEHGIEPTFSEV